VMAKMAKVRQLLAAGKKRDAGEQALEAQHLICDAHMVTSVTPDLARYDTLLDGLAEFVGHKDGDCGKSAMVAPVDFRTALEWSIRETVDKYAAELRAGRARFVWKHLGPMTRRAVERAAYFGYWLVKGAL
jgi:hypothetical protein